MMFVKRTFLTLFALVIPSLSCLVFPTSAYAKTPNADLPILKEYRANYKLTWKKIKVGTSHHVIQKIGHNHYLAEAISTPELSILPFRFYEKSEFYRKKNQIIPLDYEYETREKGNRHKGKIRFDWKNKKIKVLEGESPPILTLPNNAQDKITENLQLRLQLQEDLKKGRNSYSYTVVERNKVKVYTFNVVSEGVIDTPLGKISAVKVEHISDNQDRKTLLWFSKEHYFLLVKLQQVRKEKILAEGVIQTLNISEIGGD